MALKRKIDEKTFKKLSKDLQAEYVQKDGDYVLDVEGDSYPDDENALRRAKDHAVNERNEALKRAKIAEGKLADEEDEKARKGGDVAALEKSWKDKTEAQKTEYETKLSNKDKFISQTLVDSVAKNMAAEISTSPALLVPHIKARLTADLAGDVPATKVLGTDGSVSALSIDDLKKEFVDNKDYSAIIIASKAKGGSAPNNSDQRLGSASSENNGGKPTPLHKLSGKELAAEIKARKEEANEN